MPDKVQVVSSACAAYYSPKKACNFFVRDVAKKVGITLPSPGVADDLISAATIKWRELTAAEAIQAAGQGVFVIAGIKSKDFSKPEPVGHVGVVLPGRIGVFPRVAATNTLDTHWGKSKGDVPLTQIFPAEDVRAGKVRYFAPPFGSSGSW